MAISNCSHHLQTWPDLRRSGQEFSSVPDGLITRKSQSSSTSVTSIFTSEILLLRSPLLYLVFLAFH